MLNWVKLPLSSVTLFCLLNISCLALAKANSQAPAKQQEAIRSFAGCFEVTFDFAETFPLQKDYKIHDPYHTKTLEYVVLDEDTGDHLSLQHVLLFRGDVQKHWRQEWNYAADQIFQFRGDSTWQKVKLTAAQMSGNWVQRVFQIDDSPQYECSAPWVQWNGANYWECLSDRPVPRRDYTKRSDYHLVQGRNRQSITSDGWLHEEDNVKVVLDRGVKTPLVKEKGENHYRRVDISECDDGANYWKENRNVWHGIVDAWKQTYAARSTIHIQAPAGQPALYEALSTFAENAAKTRLGSAEITTEAKRIINTYLAN